MLAFRPTLWNETKVILSSKVRDFTHLIGTSINTYYHFSSFNNLGLRLTVYTTGGCIARRFSRLLLITLLTLWSYPLLSFIPSLSLFPPSLPLAFYSLSLFSLLLYLSTTFLPLSLLSPSFLFLSFLSPSL